ADGRVDGAARRWPGPAGAGRAGHAGLQDRLSAHAPATPLQTSWKRHHDLARMTRPSPNKLRRHLQRLQESLPVALVKRFVEADLMTQAASLSFYTLLSLAPLLVLLLWLTASLYPPAQQSLVDQIGALAGE